MSKLSRILYYNLLLPIDKIRSLFSKTSVVREPAKQTFGGTTVHLFKAQTNKGKTLDFASFRGRKMLIVNVASRCGKTPQYKYLQKLQEQYHDTLTVLAVPSGDFGDQEFENDQRIAEFCEREYHITFPVLNKVHVRGKNKIPLYNWLTVPALNGWNKQQPVWNFTKYLVNEDGQLIGYFPPSVNPLDPVITSLL